MNLSSLWETITTAGKEHMQWITDLIVANPSSSLGYMWLIAGLILLILEVGVPGLFFFISFAIGSCVAAFFAFFEFSLYVQCWTALGTSLICFSVLKYITSSKKLVVQEDNKTNVDALIGQEALVVVAIEPRTPGRIKIKGEEWPALSLHGTACHQGSVVTIVRIEGNKLIVM